MTGLAEEVFYKDIRGAIRYRRAQGLRLGGSLASHQGAPRHMVSLEEILSLVGTLDDSPGENTARERFRRYLQHSLSAVGAVRDYIEVCLKATGPQYDRALQDLLNHTGELIGFKVEFGRYQGVHGQVGFDGLWQSGGLSLVVEAKKTDVYAIASKNLVGYVDALISEKRVASWDQALGLYIVGRSDASLQQLKNMILAEKRSHQLRVASVDSILSIAELVQHKDITHEEAVTLIKPGGAVVDDVVELLARVASEASAEETAAGPPTESRVVIPVIGPPASPGAPQLPDTLGLFLMTPVREEPERSARETIKQLLDNGWYVFGERTPGRKKLKSGDRICFYQTGTGVVAQAEVDSPPERKQLPYVKDPDRYPWAFKVKNARYFFEKPIVINAALRTKLDVFRGRNPEDAWAWFVQSTRIITEHDFVLLTGGEVDLGTLNKTTRG